MAIKVASEPQDLEWPPKLLPSGESGVTTSDNFSPNGLRYGLWVRISGLGTISGVSPLCGPHCVCGNHLAYPLIASPEPLGFRHLYDS